MAESKYTVAIIGCGRLGQHYAEVYRTLPNTELVAIAEYNPARRKAVGERFRVKALYPDVEAMYREIVPDIAVVALPVKYVKEAVISSAQATFWAALRMAGIEDKVEGCGRLLSEY